MRTDTITKDYVKNADIFADIFNYYIYGGRQVVLPEQLIERDPSKISLPYGADNALIPIQRFRDVQKLYAAMTDGKIEYVLYGVENQSEIHYAMPVRNNLYDALEYAEQVEKAAKSHRKDRKQKRKQRNTGYQDSPNKGEFLSGFWKNDKLIPSITLTIFFGSEEWDGPLSLLDMMDVSDLNVLSCIDNYHLRLIAPALMADDEIMKFQSSLREVMFFIKYSKDKNNLDRILNLSKKRFQELERRAVDVIETITKSGIKYNEREVEVDMCQAIQEMRDEERQIGELKKAKEIARKLYEMGIDTDKISQAVGYTIETVQKWLGIAKL